MTCAGGTSARIAQFSSSRSSSDRAGCTESPASSTSNRISIFMSEPTTSAPLVFIVPPLDGPPTGGTSYNRQLLRALDGLGTSNLVVDVESALSRIGSSQPGTYICDSVHLKSFGRLREASGANQPVWLLLHYLPTLGRLGRGCTFEELSPLEQAALSTAEGILVTGEFLRELLLSYSEVTTRVVCVPPGTPPAVAEASAPPPDDDREPVSATVVGSLVEEKGLLPFLRALGQHARESDSWKLESIGSTTADTAYAAACRQIIATQPLLSNSVELRNALTHSETLDAIAAAHVFVSTSHMEPYGMALSEARATGVPVLALARGNAPRHADPDAGGATFDDADSLARGFFELARNRAALKERTRLARGRLVRRDWQQAAREFVEALAGAYRAFQ